ncbi:oligopeptide transport system permease protein [Raineyella antarctica]|uniref:Oligopeptide transport system permease protein n=1 Tax=Raineyella antarctica TaxID=1577474 RepID=A0A1G6GDG1_9ACTN|nr:ABC transporter permease [Raineyella antarctica]SDB80042.1 oligopeptide transport system permease protein [Raineyella antarctica]
MTDRQDIAAAQAERDRRSAFAPAAPEAVVEDAAVPLFTPDPDQGPARSLWSDAWLEMRRRPLFWFSAGLIVLVVLMAIVPQLFTFLSPQPDPNYADLSKARIAPGPGAWFGFDGQGYDVYSRTIYGARSSILVGLGATLVTTMIGGVIGIFAGYFGGWWDTILSRVGDVFFAIPLLLGGILALYTFPNKLDTPYLVMVGKVVLALGILGWPSIARLMRSSVLQVKPHDFVQAARALGAGPGRIVRSHILPNAVAPVIAVSTINLGVYIATEATLSFLGIGLQPPAISWGVAISDASGIGLVRSTPHMLLFPSLFLSITVLAFIMLGEVVRDALDPKLR